jgi:autotransporter-associated beta strand protein
MLRKFAIGALCAGALGVPQFSAPAATPVVVGSLSGFEGREEPTVIYFPDTNTFQDDPTNYTNIIDEGGGMIRSTLRNNYASLGWWDGDRATTNTDRQRAEVKGITGLGHQKVGQTFEYSFDFRTNPSFTATGNFCHIFQLKATDGNDGPPLVTVTLRKSGSAVQGQIITSSDGPSVPTKTFAFTPRDWHHFVVRITTSAEGQATGSVLTSVDGGAFLGTTNAQVYLDGSTDYRPKWGLYRSITTTNGIPVGDSWVEHRTVTGYADASNLLAWKGGVGGSNTWDAATTQNFLIGSTAAAFKTADQINFTDSTANTLVNIVGSVAPNYARVNSSLNYTLAGAGSITGGTLRKDGSGTLTLATNNSYPGLTDVRAGTLFVSGSIGNNSLVSLTGGTLQAGSNTALGSNSTVGTQINGGTLDINGFNLSTEPISVQGTGIGGAGAIVNHGAQQINALNKVTLTNNTALGGSGRWDIRGTGATLSTGGNAYTLTKTGANQISLVGATVDAALGNVAINQGVLSVQTSTNSLGNAASTVTVANGAALGLFNTSAAMNKLCVLNGGTLWSESGTGNQSTFAGAITVNSAGGILDAGSALTSGAANASAVLNITGAISGTGTVTKNGPGMVTITNPSNSWSGGTAVNAGTLAVNGLLPGAATVNSGATLQGTGTVGGALTIASGATLAPGNSAGKLTIGSLGLSAGSTTKIEIGGLTRGSQFDAIDVGGSLNLNGTLQLSLINGFTPADRDSFDIFNAISIAGAFSSFQLPDLAGTLGWDTSALYTSGALSVTAYLRGDFNRDGNVTAADIPAMLHALTDLSAYSEQYNLSPAQLASIGDLDNSDDFTNRDIQGLLNLLAAQGAGSVAAVPEPSAVLLMALTPFSVLFLKRRRAEARMQKVNPSHGAQKGWIPRTHSRYADVNCSQRVSCRCRRCLCGNAVESLATGQFSLAGSCCNYRSHYLRSPWTTTGKTRPAAHTTMLHAGCP